MMSPLAVIDKYYATDDSLRRLLLKHSWQVANRCLECVSSHSGLDIDRELVFRGALLHDIGVFATSASKIYCKGKEHYLLHGFIGAKLLRELGMEKEARICERHTGAGLSRYSLMKFKGKVEIDDYYPETIEEKLVCYADKFFSKSSPETILTFEQAYNSLLRFGKEGADRFLEWHKIFG